MVYLVSCCIIAAYVTYHDQYSSAHAKWTSQCSKWIVSKHVSVQQLLLLGISSELIFTEREIQHYFEGFYMCFTDLSRTTCRAVNPPCLQISRTDREGMIDDVILHGIWHHLCKKYSLTWPIITNLWCFTLLCTLQWHNTQYRCLLLGNVRC